MGWGPVIDDGTTFCPICRERFTPVLNVRLWRGCGTFETTQCHYMSPSLLRVSLETIVIRLCGDGIGSGTISVDDLLVHSPAVYWNMLWYNCRLNLAPLTLPLSQTGTLLLLNRCLLRL